MSQMKIAGFYVILALPMTMCLAAESPPRRVQPPQWSQDVLDAFFEDAHEQLVGTRPQRATPEKLNRIASQPSDKDQPKDAVQMWSTLIEAETLTAEIKRIHNQLAATLKKPASFSGGGNLACRRDFGLLAVLFGVIDEYDADVRWQSRASQMQQRCFLTGQNSKVASALSYASAKETHAVLGELLRGQAPADETASREKGKTKLVAISVLMQNMELSIKERLKPALSSARDFRKKSQQVNEQAQLLAVLAEVIQHKGYEYADDDTYLDEARQLSTAAQELAEAARDKNYEAARAASGRVGQSCSSCHEGYRG